MLMRRRQRAFKAVLGGIIIVAWVIPDVVAGFLWASFLAGGPQSVLPPGLLNSFVATFGLPQLASLQAYPMAPLSAPTPSPPTPPHTLLSPPPSPSLPRSP